MKKLISSLSLSALTMVVFSSCSTDLTQAQKEAITSVSVLRHRVAADAQQPVQAVDMEGHKHKDPVVYTGDESVVSKKDTGVTGVLFEEATDAGVLAKKNGNQSEIDKINSVVYPRIAEALEQRAIVAVKENGFLGSRWAPSSPHYFDGEIEAYGLQERVREGEAVFLQAVVTMRVWFVSDGKKLFSQPMELRSKNAYTVADYVENPELLRNVFQEAGNDFSVQFKELLVNKFGR
ncbi:hypothetical protein ACFPK9_11085 [Rubritalea spongiae]|uniref:ABC-type transport auxiliary lipoprotein component domain-containing protein n=1 Tax=Rubritalea spongiae TaxID=430797 RepID=A0ABW5DYQ0_9BACT